MTEPRSPRRGLWTSRAAIMHVFRWAVLLLLCGLIRFDHQIRQQVAASRDMPAQLLVHVRHLLPTAHHLSVHPDDPHTWYVLRDDNSKIGLCVTTSPEADSIIGFAGPTNLLVVLDLDERIVGFEILDSRDTPEHVEQVRADREFMTSLNQVPRSKLLNTAPSGGVSGATLTSLAIIESIQHRLTGQSTSLRFPEPIQLEEIQAVFPTARAFSRSPQQSSSSYVVIDQSDHVIGSVIRSSPDADSIVGYQGPTDTLWFFDSEQKLIDYRIRRSFDNEPYVGYIRDDQQLRELLKGKPLSEFLDSNSDASAIEGVSGATMTSQAMIEGLRQLAKSADEPPPVVAVSAQTIRYDDIGTLLVMAAASVVAFTRLRRSRRIRIALQLGLVIYFGFLNGDMVSQVVLVGWVQNDVPLERAPGFVLLIAAAFLIPALGGGSWYCHWVCPFGAAQGLLRGRLPFRYRPAGRLRTTLQLIPAVLLVAILLAAFGHIVLPLAAIEPFHAFLWPIAGWSTVAIAVVGLAASLVTPKAYCRFGCPTGAVLEYGRLSRRSQHWQWRDAIAVALLGLGIVLLTLRGREPSPAVAVSPVTHTSPSQPTPKLLHVSGVAMGTNWELHVPLPCPVDRDALHKHITVRLEELEQIFSHWRHDSIVSRFNRSATGAVVPEELAHVFEVAHRIGNETGGALDVTAAPLICLWGFGPQAHTQVPPAVADIEQAKAHVGIDKVALRLDQSRLRLLKQSPGVQLDLSAVAKGYAVDALAELVEELGIESFSVGIGGEFRTVGTAPGGRGWRIGIETPGDRLGSSLAIVVNLADKSIATSGNYRQFHLSADGKRTTHIIDPRSGYPIRHRLAQVSVIASTALEADAWATALLVLGERAGLDLARQENLAARFVWRVDDGWKVFQTPAFEACVDSMHRTTAFPGCQ